MTEPIEPVVGIPEEMAQAIAIALSHIRDWQRLSQMSRGRNRWYDIEEVIAYVDEDEDTIKLIEEALETYNEL